MPSFGRTRALGAAASAGDTAITAGGTIAAAEATCRALCWGAAVWILDTTVSREATAAALRASELTCEIVYTSPSLTGVRAAALAGLATMPPPEIIAGLRIFDAEAASRVCLTYRW